MTFRTDSPLVTVESYYPTGISQTTVVAMYKISPQQTKKVWEAESTSSQIRFFKDGTSEHTDIILTYSILPSHANTHDSTKPVISAYGNQKITTWKDDEITSVIEKPLSSTYIWEAESQSFIED